MLNSASEPKRVNLNDLYLNKVAKLMLETRLRVLQFVRFVVMAAGLYSAGDWWELLLPVTGLLYYCPPLSTLLGLTSLRSTHS